ncbi:hypothetical protein BURMUCGD2M_6325 [Burkholderia multivorans CGD2M]|nr:hypothetical protein BURMUCGD2M_6325 [Burkholderia multivorans CGD2M]
MNEEAALASAPVDSPLWRAYVLLKRKPIVRLLRCGATFENAC